MEEIIGTKTLALKLQGPKPKLRETIGPKVGLTLCFILFYLLGHFGLFMYLRIVMYYFCSLVNSYVSFLGLRPLFYLLGHFGLFMSNFIVILVKISFLIPSKSQVSLMYLRIVMYYFCSLANSYVSFLGLRPKKNFGSLIQHPLVTKWF